MNNGSGQNGVRISLLVDGALLLTGIIAASLMWADVQQLKADQVSESRVVAIEEQLKYMNQSIQDLRDQQRAGTQQVIEAIARERARRIE